MLLRSKPLRSTVNGLPFSDKINRRERALWRGSLRSREKREEPVTGEMRRNAGEDRAGTQGWRGSCQVAMPGEASGDARLPSAGSYLKASHLRWPAFSSQRPVSPHVAGVARLFLRQISIFQTLRLDRFFSKRQRIWG